MPATVRDRPARRIGPNGELALARYNFTAPLEDAGAAVTREPDAPVAAR